MARKFQALHLRLPRTLHQRGRQRLPKLLLGESLQGWGYCVFAEVVEGMDAVDKIKGVATGRSGMQIV